MWGTKHQAKADVDAAHEDCGATEPAVEITIPGWLSLLLENEMMDKTVERLNCHDDGNEQTDLLVPIFGSEDAVTVVIWFASSIVLTQEEVDLPSVCRHI